MKETAPRPWYREPWPWILMSGPAIVVVAGIVTTALAVATRDTLVTEDYYRKGLEINRELGCRDLPADVRSAKPQCRND